MRQRRALVGVEQHDIPRRRLLFAQLEPQTDARDFARDLPAFQRVPRPSEPESPFLRSTLESCDLEMVTPSRCAISAARRAKVQLVLSATGAHRSSSETLSAASALSAAGPSYGRFWVTRLDQAARLSAPCVATPSVNVTPSRTIGNWFAP
ncbi:hypothetical protein, partial [Aurantimonas sp. C2-3-R2]|uniref:hypothetical protein n=1 Tax=Aurantimonas sp. C2-3-R2 TaxID=3114363 RepID=UPI002E187551|nr:hypothetical protein [Aurantimonas sp. C2-3-R2]